jgi:hypothetical protein
LSFCETWRKPRPLCVAQPQLDCIAFHKRAATHAQPGIAEPLILALALLVLPCFVMMPGMGMGIAGSRTPKPNVTRLKSVIGHSMFGIGMYLTARLMETLG